MERQTNERSILAKLFLMLRTKEISKSTAVKLNQLVAELWLSGSIEGMRLETQPERGRVSGEIR